MSNRKAILFEDNCTNMLKLPDLDDVENESNQMKLTKHYAGSFCNLEQVALLREILSITRVILYGIN